MLKSKLVRRLLRALITLLGAGLGMAAVVGVVVLTRWLRPEEAYSVMHLVIAYVSMGLLGALVFFLLSDGIIRRFMDMGAAVERYLDRLTSAQLAASILGLLAGMMIAALLSQMLVFLGSSVFTTAFSGILYVVLGATGFSVGHRRSGSLAAFLEKGARRRGRSADAASLARPKVLDASALIDGRIADMARMGFVEGEMIVPGFVLEALRQDAASADSVRRQRGRRGLDTLTALQAEEQLSVRVTDGQDSGPADAELRLLRLAKESGAAVLVSGHGLDKLAAASGVPVLNLMALAAALRPVILTGEKLQVQVVRAGKEPGQGVGYLPDGTMIVVEEGDSLIGQTVDATVTSALQTSAGRMIFARPVLSDGKNPSTGGENG
ncbi:MAG: TRAM domain-containing protein [Eubacteriales bacterium]|nr:TRAM domain-containing protein [Eubacteriales bacterium]